MGAGDRAQGLAGIEPSKRLPALEAIELELGTKLDAGSNRTLAALLNTALDQLALELGDRREDGNGQPAVRRRRVDRRLPQAPEADPILGETVEGISRSRVDRASRSSPVTTTTSPDSASLSMRCNAARSPFAPVFFSE
jgi:hypothetical protein